MKSLLHVERNDTQIDGHQKIDGLNENNGTMAYVSCYRYLYTVLKNT